MLNVQLFGTFKISLGNQPIEIPSRPAQSLLAYLILNAGTVYRREKLAGLFWPDSGEVQARHNLRQTLWRLRKAIGEEYLLADKLSISFNPETNYRLDADILQNKADETDTVEVLIRSVSVYEEILLPGFYDEWVTLEQERLRAVFEERMRALLDKLIEEARWRETCTWAEQWIARGQVPEPAYRALMTAHAGLGDRAGVTTVFERCIAALDKELGVEPSPETLHLFQRLTSGEIVPKAQTIQSRLRPAVKLPLQPTPFIGRENDLKELAALFTDPTVRLVTILGPGGIGKTRLAIEAARAQSDAFADGVYFVSLAAVDDPNLIVTPIAKALNFPFHVRDQREQWERDHQNEQLLAYLRDKHMLLVLDNLEQLSDNILFIADILQFAGNVKMLTTSRERLNLRGETVYMVGSMRVPGKIAEEVQAIVETYDALQLFVKCAERAQPGFELTPDNLNYVIDICQLVDGLPLGIELAAAWIGLLRPQEIAAEIKTKLDFLSSNLVDVPDRQQSIRSVFESTWKRLTNIEQDVFQQLSVFRGGFTRHAAETITGATLQILMMLVNKSLVQPDYTGRYKIHELLRQFGVERLAASSAREIATRDRHCSYYTALLKRHETELDSQNQGKTLTEIETEIDNIRKAWNWAVSQRKLDELDNAMESLCEFYRIRGYLDEGYESFPPAAKTMGWQGFRPIETLPDINTLFNETRLLLENIQTGQAEVKRDYKIQGRLLARYCRFHCESPRNDGLACQVRHDALHILSQTGDQREIAYLLRYLAHVWFTPQQMRQLYAQALAIFEEHHDRRGTAEILYRLGVVATRLGEYREAEQLFQESLNIIENLGRLHVKTSCLDELGNIYWALGEYGRAKVKYQEGLDLAGLIGYQNLVATTQRHLARTRMVQNEIQAAKQLLQKSLEVYSESGLRGMKAETMAELAHVATVAGDYTAAKQLAQESLTLCEELDYKQGLVVPLTVLGEAALGLDDLQAAETYFCKAFQTAAEVWMPPYALHALVGMARLLAAKGESEWALNLAFFIRFQPASWQWSKDTLESLGPGLENQVPSEVVVAAQMWGKKKNLEAVIADLSAVAK